MRHFLLTALIAGLVAAPSSHAALTTKSKALIVMQPADLPDAAQREGQSMKLHITSDGSSFLYIEQLQLERIVVLNVSDPSHIKTVATVSLIGPSAFDFDRDLDEHYVLLRYRDGKGVAVMDISHPAQPALKPADGLLEAHVAEDLGNKAFLGKSNSSLAEPLPSDYQVIDSSNPLKPQLITTVSQVRSSLTNSATGTTFLLGSSGLTVLRRPDVEWQQNLSAHN
jgi:hypothetical protein